MEPSVSLTSFEPAVLSPVSNATTKSNFKIFKADLTKTLEQIKKIQFLELKYAELQNENASLQAHLNKLNPNRLSNLDYKKIEPLNLNEETKILPKLDEHKTALYEACTELWKNNNILENEIQESIAIKKALSPKGKSFHYEIPKSALVITPKSDFSQFEKTLTKIDKRIQKIEFLETKFVELKIANAELQLQLQAMDGTEIALEYTDLQTTPLNGLNEETLKELKAQKKRFYDVCADLFRANEKFTNQLKEATAIKKLLTYRAEPTQPLPRQNMVNTAKKVDTKVYNNETFYIGTAMTCLGLFTHPILALVGVGMIGAATIKDYMSA